MWEFTPYNLHEWNIAQERIIFVALEPNGNNPNPGRDMGEWFRTASPENNFHNNPQFFRRCEIMLNGINIEIQGNIFNNFRFMDLTAIEGGPVPNPGAVEDYVRDNMCEVIRYFNSTDEDFGLSPHLIVLLGNTVQSIFSSLLRPKLMHTDLNWVAMPHPSAQVGYEGLTYASQRIRQHVRPINRPARKWVYHRENFDDWRDIG